MRVYHGSLERVPTPEIRQAARTLDYGIGFYTTTSAKQAEEWVRKRMRDTNARKGYVNEYELDLKALKQFNCAIFDSPTDEWIDFVMSNRMDRHFTHDYDVVYGPVANDRVYACFALYEGGVMSKQNLLAELRTYDLVDQYLFHTERALIALTFVKAKEISL
ncbi:MAG: DUF3990 domain-containing protein [Paludibacteraceae bacterium]|nr:DUF3990 domain-containing protein [Paludibacteraceae bacterium]